MPHPLLSRSRDREERCPTKAARTVQTEAAGATHNDAAGATHNNAQQTANQLRNE